MDRGATPAELAFALAAFTKLKSQHRSLKALARERARTIACLQCQLDKRDDAAAPAIQLAERSAIQFLEANRALRLKAEKELASTRAELVVLRREAEERSSKAQLHMDELRLAVKALKIDVQREQDARRHADGRRKTATANLDLLREEHADFAAKAQRAQARAEKLASDKAQQDEHIATLHEELGDLRQDHRVLLEERLKEREVFRCETETLADEVVNLQHETRLLQDKLVTAQLMAEAKVTQAIHLERDRAERELAEKLDVVKRADNAELQMLADQLSVHSIPFYLCA